VKSVIARLFLLGALLLLAISLAGPQPVSAQGPASPGGQRAVVLGGGGITGVAWEVGMLKGLRDAGIDLTQPDLIVGTSAGAIVGARILAGQSLDDFYDEQLAAPTRASSAESLRIDREYFQETSRLWQRPGTTQAQRMEVGQRAVAATQVIPEEEWVQYMAASLRVPDWPSARLQITAVDVFDGTTRLIGQTQGVPLERAVAASSAMPGMNAPITLGD
jgi:NTE family protein